MKGDIYMTKKSYIKYIALVLIIFLTFGFTAFALDNFTEKQNGKNYYPTAMVVTDLEKMPAGFYTVTVKTMTGFEYAFYSDSGDWMEGDIVGVLMDSKGTENITDDEIMDAQYAGYGDPAGW